MPKSNAWIKFEKSLIHDPRVGLIAEKLMDHTPALRNAVTGVTVVTLVLGGLMRMWAYSDTYIRYDDVTEGTPDLVNQFVGIENFVQFLPQDWFQVVDATHVKFPEFHTHNASRSKNAARQARFRERAKSKQNTVDVTVSVTPALRNAVTGVTHNALDRDRDQDLLSPKDLSTHHPVDTQLLDTPRRATARRLPDDFGLTPERRATADAEHVDCEREMAKFKDYWLASSGATARKHDWDAAWRNWCRKAGEQQPRLNGRGTSVEKVVHFGPPRDLWGETAK